MTIAIDIGTLIVETPGICGGRPRIAGTGVSVRRIVETWKQGRTPEEITDEFPHLTSAQVYAALAFYHANQEQMDCALAEETEDVKRLEREFTLGRARPSDSV